MLVIFISTNLLIDCVKCFSYGLVNLSIAISIILVSVIFMIIIGFFAFCTRVRFILHAFSCITSCISMISIAIFESVICTELDIILTLVSAQFVFYYAISNIAHLFF